MTMGTMASRIGKKLEIDSTKVSPVLAAWARTRILFEAGGPDKGKGNFRRFTEEELLKAAVLFEFYWEGFPIGRLRSARRRMDFHLKERPTILRQAAKGEAWDFLLARLPHTLPLKGVFDEEDWAIWAEFKKRPYAESSWGQITIPGSGTIEFNHVTKVRVDKVLMNL